MAYGAGGGYVGSEVMHSKPLLDAPEQVCLSGNREEKMTCHDSLGNTDPEKKGWK